MKRSLQVVLATVLMFNAMPGRAEDDAPVITLGAGAAAQSGIETAHPAVVQVRRQLRAYATVLDPGPLTELGNRYAAAQAGLRSAQAKLAASQTAFERAQGLYRDGGNASLAELQAAEAAYRSDQADVSAARSAARSLAATAEQSWGPVLGASLVAGTPALARLIERRELLLQVTLPPGTALPHAPAHAALDTGRDRRAAIELVSAAPRTDPRIQGVSFFYRVPAASGVLPGMQLLAYLVSGEPVTGAVVPAQAVVWWQDRAWIYRVAGLGAFARVQIPTDQPAPGGGYVVADLPQGTEVVTRGAQLLLSEEFRAQIQVGD